MKKDFISIENIDAIDSFAKSVRIKRDWQSFMGKIVIVSTLLLLFIAVRFGEKIKQLRKESIWHRTNHGIDQHAHSQKK